MPTLIEKFDALSVLPENQIPLEDKEWCEAEQAKFQQVLSSLDIEEAFYRERMDTEVNSCMHYCGPPVYNYGNTWMHKGWKDLSDYKDEEDTNVYDLYKFCSGYNVLHIEKLRKTCKQSFVERVCKYFIKKYAITLSEYWKRRSDINDYCDYKIILGLIKEEVGMLDFKSNAVEQAMIRINNSFQYQHVTVMGNILEFKKAIHLSRGGPYLYPTKNGYYGSGIWESLDNAISIFEREELKQRFAIRYLDGQTCGDWDTVLNCEKVEGIKLFKSGTLHLRFHEVSQALQFVNRFQLKS